jgi:hypothetical protein
MLFCPGDRLPKKDIFFLGIVCETDDPKQPKSGLLLPFLTVYDVAHVTGAPSSALRRRAACPSCPA